jgi:hypothetical protein
VSEQLLNDLQHGPFAETVSAMAGQSNTQTPWTFVIRDLGRVFQLNRRGRFNAITTQMLEVMKRLPEPAQQEMANTMIGALYWKDLEFHALMLSDEDDSGRPAVVNS